MILGKQLRFTKLAFKSLRARSVRSWITIAGIVVSIAVILTLLTLSSALQTAVVNTFNDFGTNRIIIFGPDSNPAGLSQNTLTDNTVRDIADLGLFEKVIPRLIVPSARVTYRNQDRYFDAAGFDSDQGPYVLSSYHIDKYLTTGRFLQHGDRGVAILGASVAKSEPDVEGSWSKPIQNKNSIQINGQVFSVIGVLNSTGQDFDNAIFISLDDAREIVNKTHEVTMIDAILKPNIDMTGARFRLERMLNQTVGKNNYTVITPEGILRQLSQIITILQAVLVALASISLIVGAVGIMNTMFTSVLEREKEIGIMKSIGSTNLDVMQIFMIESGLIGLIGGIAGVIFGIGLSYLVGEIAKLLGFNLLAISISPLYVIGCLVFSFIIGMISGIVPSYRAARKRIIDTLRDA